MCAGGPHTRKVTSAMREKRLLNNSSLEFYKREGSLLAGKNVQQVKVPAVKPNDLSSIPGIHIGEGENQLL